MSIFAKSAVAMGIIHVSQPAGSRFPGRNGVPGMPYIFNVRGAPASLKLRKLIVDELVFRFRQNFENAEMIVGLSKAGTIWGGFLAWELKLPVGVVHDKPRDSGLQRQVEGSVAGRRIILIDNLIDSQRSLVDAARITESAGGKIDGAMAVIRRTVGGPKHFPARFPIFALCTDTELEEEGLRQDVLRHEHLFGFNDVAATVPPSSGSPSNCDAQGGQHDN